MYIHLIFENITQAEAHINESAKKLRSFRVISILHKESIGYIYLVWIDEKDVYISFKPIPNKKPKGE
jgi:hypothetical protein